VPQFEDVTAKRALLFNTPPTFEKIHRGVHERRRDLLDYDRDGWLDIYFTMHPRSPWPSRGKQQGRSIS